MWRVTLLRRLLSFFHRSADVLSPSLDSLVRTGAELRDPGLRRLLANDALGAWALDVFTIDFLWEKLQVEQPRAILECGAGASTVMLGQYAQLARGDQRPIVVSLEQGKEVRDQAESRLRTCGLGGVHVLHAPLDANCNYTFDCTVVEACLHGVKLDWILIDGPAGPERCRLETLPNLALFCRPGTRWFLDDAFRDGELEILNTWARMPGIKVEGIYALGKGLATGVVTDPNGMTRRRLRGQVKE
jgi:predicted O-methyltransferase YrrM